MTALELENLTKSYGDRQALDGATFSVGSGEIFGFVGSNGAGKTTAMRIVLGVLAADDGEVRWAGRPITLDDRRRIGYMPEERGLYPKMKVGQQLEYLARLHGLTAAAATAATKRWTETLGVAERLGDEVQKLSLGNQQRVQLAAALVHEPDVLVLDEPFSGLDPVAVDVMSGVLRERSAAGVPVVFSSHQLDLVERLCDRVGIIRSGRMVATGTIDELRRTDRPRWAVVGPPPSAWANQLSGARVLSDDDAAGARRTVVETPGGDGQDVLAAALAAGSVHEFAPSRPSLSDLFRHAVASEEAAR
ncbi:MAG: ATP-binding cassette domain-containing protein [Promicromonosporaceae bacterium]|nr:ATP-binding cassette domain-containing protein [Promicromonosporaceae bacterium]